MMSTAVPEIALAWVCNQASKEACKQSIKQGPKGVAQKPVLVGSSSQADCLLRNSAMDDSIGGS